MRKDVLPFTTTWVKMESTMISEINQIEKEKHHLILLTHEIQKKKQKRQTHRMMLTKG